MNTYLSRRNRLRELLKEESGIIVFIGNVESAAQYRDNGYKWRQDSNWLYYFGIDEPRFAAVMDLDAGTETVYADDFGIVNFASDAPGDAARAGAEIQHLGGAVEVHFAQRAHGLGDQLLRLRPGDQHAGPHGEAVPAELRDSQHILDGLAGAEAPQSVLQLRLALRRHGRLRLDDVGVARHAQQFFAEHQNQTPRLGRRVKVLQAGRPAADEVGQPH